LLLLPAYYHLETYKSRMNVNCGRPRPFLGWLPVPLKGRLAEPLSGRYWFSKQISFRVRSVWEENRHFWFPKNTPFFTRSDGAGMNVKKWNTRWTLFRIIVFGPVLMKCRAAQKGGDMVNDLFFCRRWPPFYNLMTSDDLCWADFCRFCQPNASLRWLMLLIYFSPCYFSTRWFFFNKLLCGNRWLVTPRLLFAIGNAPF